MLSGLKNNCFRLFAAAAIMLAAACTKPYSPTDPHSPSQDSPEQDEFPIVAWTGIEASDAANAFGPMKECGFNIYLGWYDDFAEVETILAAAKQHDVKVITRSKQLLTAPTLEAKKLKDDSSFYGYFIDDEPEVSELNTLGDIVRRIKTVDKDHPCYINLYPNWAWGGNSVYISRLNSYLTSVPADFISFDFYPIYQKSGVRYIKDGWFKNLEDVRKVCRAKALPFWGFALTLASAEDSEGVSYPVPTLGELRLQQFANLVYGAQGFQYWTYWGIYHTAATAVYNPVKQVNKDLQVLARYFHGADIQNVWHYGDVPEGTAELTVMPDGVDSMKLGGPAIISQFENKGKKYLAVVNKNFKQAMSLTISFKSDAIQFDNLGYKATVKESSRSLEAGNIAVFQIN